MTGYSTIPFAGGYPAIHQDLLLSSMPLSRKLSNATLTLLQGDITKQDVDVIVNAANSSLLGGGGVDGAIHRAAGPELLVQCKAIVKRQGRCPPGEAVITGGGRLKARFVIHTVGPIWHGGSHGEDEILSSAYRNSLRIAAEHELTSIAFPSISTGAYGFPIERASRVAHTTVVEFVETRSSLGEVRFVVFSHDDYEVYERLMR
jgi:O-acetyl-ADP-ribose deacetylase (regulator of RNase III)